MECQHTERSIVHFKKRLSVDDVNGLTWWSCSAQTTSTLANTRLEHFWDVPVQWEEESGEREIPEGHHP